MLTSIFHRQGQFLSGVHQWELENKENSWSQALKVSAAAYDNVPLREWVNKEFVWDF